MHGVFWLEDDIIKQYQNEEGDFIDEKVVELIDKWISVCSDTEDLKLNELVKSVNHHHHTQSCRKHGTDCRFHFPKFPSDRTLIAKPLPDDMDPEERKEKVEKYQNVLKQVKEKLNVLEEDQLKNLTIKDFLDQLNIKEEDYYEALQVSEKGKMVIHRRELGDVFTNNYNDSFLSAWQANMDLQFCLDQYAVITYICDYLGKDDSGLTEVLKKAIKETEGCNDFERLNYLKQKYFQSRQLGVCEAAYTLVPGLNLKGSNVKTKFVATGFPENRTVFLQKVSEDKKDDKLDKDCASDSEDEPAENENEPIQEPENIVTLPGREGKFTVSKSLHDKYAMRPSELKNICFAQFAMAYDDTKSIPKREKDKMVDGVHSEPGNIRRYDNDVGLPRYIILSNGSSMRLRKKPYVLRLHASHRKQGSEQLYAELQLYYPWINEVSDLKRKNEDEIVDLYLKHEETIDSNRTKTFPFSSKVERMQDLVASLDDDGRPKDLLDGLDSNAVQENEDDKEEMPEIDDSVLPDEAGVSNPKPDGCSFRPIELPSDEDEMIRDVMGMSEEQRLAFDMIIGFCKDVKMSRKSKWSPDPPQLIIHGKYLTDFMIFVINQGPCNHGCMCTHCLYRL